jgi:hypothetical protein
MQEIRKQNPAAYFNITWFAGLKSCKSLWLLSGCVGDAVHRLLLSGAVGC